MEDEEYFGLDSTENGEDFGQNIIKDIRHKQLQEKASFEEKIEKHDKLLLKYRIELYNESPHTLERLFQLERIISQFIDLLNDDKYNIGYHNFSIDTESYKTFTGFAEWKTRLSDQLISRYSRLLDSVSIRARQKPINVSNDSNLSPEESDQLSDNLDETSLLDQQNEKFSQPEIAIIHHINGWMINLNNADEIAQKYGYTSGQALMRAYEKLDKEADRTGLNRYRVKNYRNIEKMILPKYKAQYYRELNETIKNNGK